jgi:PST family polysaccharide transporter
VEFALLRPLLKNNVALLVQYGAGAAVPLLLVPHLARSLGLEAFGTLSVLLAWSAYATTLVHYAFHLTGPARAARTPTQLPGLLTAVLQARGLLLMAALAALALAWAVGAIPSSTLAVSLLILVLLPACAAIETTWHLQVRDRFLHTAALSVLGTAVAVWFGFGFVQGRDEASITWAAAALVAGAFIVSAGSFTLSAFTTGKLPVASRAQVSSVLKEGKPLFASQLVALAYGGSGPIIIGWLAGMEQAGTYAVLARLVMALCGVADLVHTAAYPRLAQLYPTDRAAYLRLVHLVVLSYLAVAATLGALGWVFRDQVLVYLYGSGGSEWLGIYGLGLLWLAVGSFGGVVTGYFAVSGQPGRAYRLNLLVMVASLAIGIPAAFLYGAAGWLVGLLAGQAVIAVSAVHHWKKERDHHA